MSDLVPIQPALQLMGEEALARDLTTLPHARYDYSFNTPGSIVMLVASGLMLVGAVVVWVMTGLSQFWWFLLAALLVLSAVGTWFYVHKWYKFSQEAFLLLSRDHLYIGDNQEAWRLGWDILTTENMGFDSARSNRLTSALKIELAGQRIPMFLYNPLAFIGDLQGLMGDILFKLQEDRDEESVASLEGDIDSLVSTNDES